MRARALHQVAAHPELRAGIGYDIHPLVTGRPLMLGGVRVPSVKGLDGHSDADCLVHAMVDALLGAAGQGDIGRQFGVRRPRYRRVSSLVFLQATARTLAKARWAIINMDATVVCEAPKLGPHLPAMRARVARALRVDPSRVNIKATTAKGLGLLGVSQAIAAMVVVMLRKAI